MIQRNFARPRKFIDTLQNNTTGQFNTTTGRRSLFNNTTGDYNVGLGYEVLKNNKTGTGIVATGYRALFSDSVGIVLSAGTLNGVNTPTYSKYGNIAYGTRALYTNTTGQNQTLIQKEKIG